MMVVENLCSKVKVKLLLN